jgi:hypothetical protein
MLMARQGSPVLINAPVELPSAASENPCRPDS